VRIAFFNGRGSICFLFQEHSYWSISQKFKKKKHSHRRETDKTCRLGRVQRWAQNWSSTSALAESCGSPKTLHQSSSTNSDADRRWDFWVLRPNGNTRPSQPLAETPTTKPSATSLQQCRRGAVARGPERVPHRRARINARPGERWLWRTAVGWPGLVEQLALGTDAMGSFCAITARPPAGSTVVQKKGHRFYWLQLWGAVRPISDDQAGPHATDNASRQSQ